MKRLSVAVLLVGSAFWLASVEAEEETPQTIAEFTESMVTHSGYVPFYWDNKTGKIYLQISEFDHEFLYVSGLSSGIGSNDIGLDRGQLGGTRIVRFERVGPKILLRQTNYDYRALSENEAERNSVKEAFAESILWGFTVEVEEDDRILIDATDFLLRDAHDVAGQLKSTDQGTFNADASRSAISLARTKNFENNTEFDAVLTFTGEPAGSWIRSVTPDATAVTVHLHHSFVQLPDDDYTPRKFDPRSGVFATRFYDYATPIGENLAQRYAERHRLRKVDPSAAMSDPVEPIIYYLDPGTPEPIRSALLDGARWWNQAFEAAGYRDAFQVEMLPEDADPLDINYNVIQWVHRSTRGWSYGSTVTDPRTGEIIKGHVTLGSLRVRQDYLIAQALTAPFRDGQDRSAELEEFALARLRQLSAHEVGHTLGFAHNFASSADGHTSVMDYPHPFIQQNGDGSIDLSNAYGVGIGEWDKATVAYAYQDFPDDVDEDMALAKIVDWALDRGLQFISDADARPLGGAHPDAHLWDNGVNAADELERVLKIRAHSLAQFGENNIRTGAPVSTLEELLVPLYLFHRYQTEAAIKLIGGVRYAYALRGDGQTVTELVLEAEQRSALDTVLKTLHHDTLTLPENVIDSIPPRVYSDSRHREVFDIRTGVTLDPVAMAETAADMTLETLLHPARASRLVEQHARARNIPGLDRVLASLIEETWKQPNPGGLAGEVQYAVNERVLEHLMRLSQDESASQAARDSALLAVMEINKHVETQDGPRAVPVTHRIKQFLDHPQEYKPRAAPTLPPGSPIGTADAYCALERERVMRPER